METLTPFQTVGPYLRLGLRTGAGPLPAATTGVRIVIRGRLFDGERRGISDGVLEWWYPGLPVIQRTLTEEDGSFVLETTKPGVVSIVDGRAQAPHFAVRVLGRGILTHYMTRLYFADEPSNEQDPVLTLVPQHRRKTLLATAASPNEYHFDVVVQGENETVFFDV